MVAPGARYAALAALTVLSLAQGCGESTRDYGGASGSAGIGGSAAGTETGGASGSPSAGRGGTAGGTVTGGGAGEAGAADGGAGGSDSGGAAGSSSGEGGGGTGGESGEGGADGCGTGQICLPPLPAGWSGPIVATAGSDMPACPADYPTLAFDSYAQLNSQPAQCTCQCGTLGGTCPEVLKVSNFDGDVCDVPNGMVSEFVRATCFSQNGTAAFSIDPPTGLSCGSGTVKEELPPTSRGGVARACGGGTSVGSCANDGTCWPRAEGRFGAGICIFRAGEHECPAGYSLRSITYLNLEDDRACPASCTCSPQSAACTVSLRTFKFGNPGNGCAFESTTVLLSSSEANCLFSPTSDVTGARYDTAPGLSGICSGTDPAPTGTAVPADPITSCCIQ